MENVEQLKNYNEEYLNFIQELKALDFKCYNNLNSIKIKRINDFVSTSYPDLQEEFEKRFPDSFKTYGFKNNVYILKNILDFILNKEKNEEIFEEFTNDKFIIANNFIDLLNKYLNNDINLKNIKNEIFLISHDIKPDIFNGLNHFGLLALCEMKEKGIDIYEYKECSNLKLELLNEVANGKFKNNKDELFKKNQIIMTIDSCFKNKEINEIELNENNSLIFEKDDLENNVCIYSNKDLINPIAIINNSEIFIDGNLNDILKHIPKEISYKELNKDKNSIDNIISNYNEITNNEILNKKLLDELLKIDLEKDLDLKEILNEKKE